MTQPYAFGANPTDDMLLLAHAEQTYSATSTLDELAHVPTPVDVRGPASRALVWPARAEFAGGAVVVALRGSLTEEDWALNSKLDLVPRSSAGDRASRKLVAMLSPRGAGARVHAGFAEALANLKAAGLVEAIRAVLRQPHARGRVLLTGHSLGGALSVLLGLDLALSAGGAADVAAVAWGAPMVGDEAFAALCRRTASLRIVRVENTTDLVCRMPRVLAPLDPTLAGLADYCHAGESCVRLDEGHLVEQATQYAQRVISVLVRLMGDASDGWRVLGRLSSHSIDAYRDNLRSLGVPAFERAVKRAAALAAFVALAGSVLAEAQRELSAESRRRELAREAVLGDHSNDEHGLPIDPSAQPSGGRTGGYSAAADNS